MNEVSRPVGTTIRIQRRIHDGAILLTGLTVKFSIRRRSDGRYWDGSAFTNTNYAEVNATDANLAAANNHNKGLYYYDIAGPASTPDVYEWASVYVSGSFEYVETGEIYWSALTPSRAAALDSIATLLSDLASIKARVLLALPAAGPGANDGLPFVNEDGLVAQSVTLEAFNTLAQTQLQNLGLKLAAGGLDLVIPEPDSPALNLRQAVALLLSVLGGKCAGLEGAAPAFKSLGGTTTRVAATVDENGNRSAVVVTPPA